MKHRYCMTWVCLKLFCTFILAFMGFTQRWWRYLFLYWYISLNNSFWSVKLYNFQWSFILKIIWPSSSMKIDRKPGFISMTFDLPLLLPHSKVWSIMIWFPKNVEARMPLGLIPIIKCDLLSSVYNSGQLLWNSASLKPSISTLLLHMQWN